MAMAISPWVVMPVLSTVMPQKSGRIATVAGALSQAIGRWAAIAVVAAVARGVVTDPKLATKRAPSKPAATPCLTTTSSPLRVNRAPFQSPSPIKPTFFCCTKPLMSAMFASFTPCRSLYASAVLGISDFVLWVL